MARIDSTLYHVKDGKLFRTIAIKGLEWLEKNPGKSLTKLGVGDVTQPLAKAVVEAMKKAADEMGDKATFHGYAHGNGYEFLIDNIIKYDYNARGVELNPADVFISDGSTSDLYSLTDIFSRDAEVLVPDPAYPAYVDMNMMLGRKIHYVGCDEAHGFIPQPPDYGVDIVYLCSPNNPTGALMELSDLQMWVDYAKKWDAVIIMDSAYESFITGNKPHSIFEAKGAQDVAVEIRSFSKTAGFTGVRCSYAIVPNTVMCWNDVGERVSLRELYIKKKEVRFFGVGYVAQSAANAYYSESGHQESMDNTAYYKNNGKVIKGTLEAVGIKCIGGTHSPYIWMKCPGGMGSWEFFDRLLGETGVVMTPGAGFGPSGDGWMRISSFGDAAATKKGIDMVADVCKKITAERG